MRFSIKFTQAFLSSLVLLLLPFSVFAQYKYQLTPAITASGHYNDNIFLSPTNEVSDYLTLISPSIEADVLTEHTSLEFRYAPTFVFYREFDDNDTTRHRGTLTFGQQLGKHLKFDLSDTFYKSEQSLEYADFVTGARRTRFDYWRNYGNASVGFLFGPENALTLGYRHNYLNNEDPTIDDGRIQTPYGKLAYWFNVKNGVELNYGYIKADFWQDVGTPREDYTGNEAGISYIRRFTPHTSGFIRYDLTTRDFEALAEEYDIHAPMAGFSHAFSPYTSLTLSGGYFVVDFERTEDESGPKYNVEFKKRFERGNFTIGGDGGWWFYSDYIDPQNRGFTRYYSGRARFDYQLHETVRFYANGFYRLDRRRFDSREWDIWRGGAGISWRFLRYFSLSLDYSYADRNDDVDSQDYKSNRVTLSLRAGKLFQW